jgi:hypothetical protein
MKYVITNYDMNNVRNFAIIIMKIFKTDQTPRLTYLTGKRGNWSAAKLRSDSNGLR